MHTLPNTSNWLYRISRSSTGLCLNNQIFIVNDIKYIINDINNGGSIHSNVEEEIETIKTEKFYIRGICLEIKIKKNTIV